MNSIAHLYAAGSMVASIEIPSEQNGWPYEEVIRYCFVIHNKCLEQQKFEATSPDKAFYAMIMNTWQTYDHVSILNYIIPRSAMNDFFKGNITEAEFVQRFKDGSYLISKCTPRSKCAWVGKVDRASFYEAMGNKYGFGLHKK